MQKKSNYEKNLLRCAFVTMLRIHENDMMQMAARDFTQKEMCVHYKTGEKFDINNYKLLKQTLLDFAEKFVKPKNENKYKDFADKILHLTWFYFFMGNINLRRITEDAFNTISDEPYVMGILEDMTSGYEKKCEKQKNLGNIYKVKKQIENYETMMGKSYESIFNYLKKHPDPEKPEREKYIKADEELKK